MQTLPRLPKLVGLLTLVMATLIARADTSGRETPPAAFAPYRSEKVFSVEDLMQKLTKWSLLSAPPDGSSISAAFHFQNGRWFQMLKVRDAFEFNIVVLSLSTGRKLDAVKFVRAKGSILPKIPQTYGLPENIVSGLEDWLVEQKIEYQDNRFEVIGPAAIEGYMRSFRIKTGNDREQFLLLARSLVEQFFKTTPPYFFEYTADVPPQ